MLFSTRDIELLRLVCWCKNIAAPTGNVFGNFLNSDEIDLLGYLGFISKSKDGRMIRPRPVAYRLLADAGIDFKPDMKPQTKESLISRRLTAAQILLTFYRAGIPVFEDNPPTDETPSYVPSFAARRSSPGNPYGSTRFYGIFYTPQEALSTVEGA